MHVDKFMTKNPVACEVGQTVEDVARLMRDKGVGCVVVLENGKVSGIVTDRDIVARGLANGKGVETKVEQVMSKSPGTLTVEDNIFAAVDTMRSAGVARRIPVVDENDILVGIVSISDIAVIAKDLLDAVMLEETHHTLEETKILTGAKRFVKDMRRPTKLDRVHQEQPTQQVTGATPPGTTKSGGAGRNPERT